MILLHPIGPFKMVNSQRRFQQRATREDSGHRDATDSNNNATNVVFDDGDEKSRRRNDSIRNSNLHRHRGGSALNNTLAGDRTADTSDQDGRGTSPTNNAASNSACQEVATMVRGEVDFRPNKPLTRHRRRSVNRNSYLTPKKSEKHLNYVLFQMLHDAEPTDSSP